MPKLKPITSTNPKLRKICEPITLRELRTKKTQDLIESLLSYVYATNNKGADSRRDKPSVVGLAANQLGVNQRIVVVDLGIGHKSYSDIHVLVNPVIKWKSKTLTERSEGCVNLNGIHGFVKRSTRVKLDAYDRSGNAISLDIHGWPAILLQHEVGHLNGELFIDLLPNPKKAHLVDDSEVVEYKRNKKSWKKFVDVSDLVKH